MRKFAAATLSGACLLFGVGQASAAAFDADAVKRIQAIMNRPLYSHSQFGLEVLSLETGQVLYALNGNQLFMPGSTTKLVTEGTALAALGPDFRFHTKIYRTGPIEGGVVKGDLVLVASGDPNLSGRIQPDGTLSFTDEDHAYDIFEENTAVAGDPLLVIKEFAQKIEAAGIKSVSGRILVDASLFPQGQREGGSNTVLSPVVLNDNLVDVTVTPGPTAGAPSVMTVSPVTSNFHFVNQVKTSAAGSRYDFAWAPEVKDGDGSRTITLTGDMPVGHPPKLHAYQVREPDLFVEVALTDALAARGIKLAAGQSGKPDWDALKKSYSPENVVAEHVSPPLTEEVKVTLKVSQNLHAAMGPYIIGAYKGEDKSHPLNAGFMVMHKILAAAGLDLTAAAQSEGAGAAADFTPDFTVHYLRFMSQQPYFKAFYNALPILGRDGSLAHNVPNLPAAGHVHAKTGTNIRPNILDQDSFLDAKALAGYIETPKGLTAFALYANRVPGMGTEKGMAEVGDALGEISNVLYEFLAKDGHSASAKKH